LVKAFFYLLNEVYTSLNHIFEKFSVISDIFPEEQNSYQRINRNEFEELGLLILKSNFLKNFVIILNRIIGVLICQK